MVWAGTALPVNVGTESKVVKVLVCLLVGWLIGCVVD
jgi:hypothetical protein